MPFLFYFKSFEMFCFEKVEIKCFDLIIILLSD